MGLRKGCGSSSQVGQKRLPNKSGVSLKSKEGTEEAAWQRPGLDVGKKHAPQGWCSHG